MGIVISQVRADIVANTEYIVGTFGIGVVVVMSADAKALFISRGISVDVKGDGS